MFNSYFGEQISSIHEDKSGAQSYIGRLMNYQTELMAWRDNLPSHLVFEKNEKNSPTGKWKDIVWVQRQREAVQVRKSSKEVRKWNLLRLKLARFQSCNAHDAPSVLHRVAGINPVLFLQYVNNCLPWRCTRKCAFNSSDLKRGFEQRPLEVSRLLLLDCYANLAHAHL